MEKRNQMNELAEAYANDKATEFSQSVKNAYLEGYKTAYKLVETIKDSIKVGSLRWCQFNYGATREYDYNNGDYSEGVRMSYYEASNIQGLRLPTKDEFLLAYNTLTKCVLYNTPASSNYFGIFNARLLLKVNDQNYISIYTCCGKDDKKNWIDIGRKEWQQEILLWLADEVSATEALAVKIIIDFKLNGRKVICDRPLYPEFITLPKTSLLMSHQIITLFD